jgi:site-specific recombinase XerD
MNRTVVSLLEKKQAENGHHRFVFMRNNGHPKALTPRFVQYKFKELVDKVGIEDFHFHDLRHAFGCKLVDHGVDLLFIKECMAHKSIQSTLVYVRPNGDKVKKAFERLDNGVKDGVKK